MRGWYYLDGTNIVFSDVNMPDHQRWEFDSERRETAWLICIEAYRAMASLHRIRELAEKWQLTYEDSQEFCRRFGVEIYKDGYYYVASINGKVNTSHEPYFALGNLYLIYGESYQNFQEFIQANSTGLVPALPDGPTS